MYTNSQYLTVPKASLKNYKALTHAEGAEWAHLLLQVSKMLIFSKRRVATIKAKFHDMYKLLHIYTEREEGQGGGGRKRYTLSKGRYAFKYGNSV